MKFIKLAFAATIVVGSASSLVIAHDGATGMVMQRMEAMKEIGTSMKTFGAMLKGEKAFSATEAEAAAMLIAGHGKHIGHMFPEGSLDKPTEALPVIWTRWDEFIRIAREMETSAQALAEASKNASSAQDILPNIEAVGKSCKACHQEFRLAK
ncbi:MAG: cytochrome c [Anderseniella sp.]